ncbi:MAG TPA: PQQ-dependent sugar dehydrogenase [Candidatus Dormibacteraeota bacterium]
MTSRLPRRMAAAAVAGLLLGACGGSGGGGGGAAGRPPTTTLTSGGVRLQEVARLSSPVAMATRAGDSSLYVVEQAGHVRRIRNGQLDAQPFLDVTRLLRSGGEQGMLGIAFPADGRHMYLDYTDTNGDTRIAEYAMTDAGGVDAGSRRELLFIKQPYPNHNGGQLAFGRDGDLYIGMGDGGSAGDPQGNGQSLQSLLGKILRIAPAAAGGRPYGIPADNPFAGRSDARPEIWAYGLRNPWRFSFDPPTGDLWIADVGQGAWEEVDHQPGGSKGGKNYGWNRLEGTHPYKGDAPPNAVPPIIEYSHDDGSCTVIGGYVYHGDAVPALRGAYLYGDYCAGWIAAVTLRGSVANTPTRLGLKVPNLASFGVDQAGDLYAMSTDGPLYRFVAG